MNKGRDFTQVRYKRYVPESQYPHGTPVWLLAKARATAVVDGLLYAVNDYFSTPARYDVDYAGGHIYWRFSTPIPFTSRFFIARVRTNLRFDGGTTISSFGRISGNADTWDRLFDWGVSPDLWNPAFTIFCEGTTIHTGGGLSDFAVTELKVPSRSEVIAYGVNAYETAPRRVL